MLFIGYTICRLFHQNALSFVILWRDVFYVDIALMIISWKRDVGSIQMQNIILYVVVFGSFPIPFLLFFLYYLSIGNQCHNMMLSYNALDQ